MELAAPGDPAAAGRGGLRGNSATVITSHSMVKLPEVPMKPRVFDDRVGYFSRNLIDYGRADHRAMQRTYITRYRLEKKDPNAEISEPVKPIVYYVDPATPAKFVQYVKKGIEDWRPAFEAAGFRNAIVAKDAPTDDPDWSAEDARYSVIRWLPSTTENAQGPHIHDPRSGEILEADVLMYHNVQNLSKNWYFVQAGPLDPRARRLPLPDDLMGELVRFVVAHEVGHTLGFQHNMKASAMYSVAQVRDRNWVKQNGHTPSIMDYSRFNYVAQPEDNIDVADLIPKVGPYDKWATMWGYKPIPDAKTPDDEKATLDRWAREQDQTPWFRFSTAQAGSSDPYNLTEAVGDADAVLATTLGVKNLARVATLLLDGDQYAERRPLSRADRGLRPPRRAVDARDESRDAAGRWSPLAAEAHRTGRTTIHARAAGAAGRRRSIPAEQRLHDADVPRAARTAATDGAGRRHQPRSQRAELGDEFTAAAGPPHAPDRTEHG